MPAFHFRLSDTILPPTTVISISLSAIRSRQTYAVGGRRWRALLQVRRQRDDVQEACAEWTSERADSGRFRLWDWWSPAPPP